MKPRMPGSPGWRAAVDVLLIVLLALALISQRGNGQARSALDPASPTQAAPAEYGAPLPAEEAPDGSSASSAALLALDKKLVARLIAAENAVLTPPLFLTDLPLVVR